MAAVNEKSREFDRAEKILKRLHQSHPDDAPVSNFYGYLLAEMNQDLDFAQELVESALAKEPNNGFYLDSLGWVLYKKGDYRGAVRELERAVAEVGEDPVILEHLGDAYSALSRFKDALAAYRHSITPILCVGEGLEVRRAGGHVAHSVAQLENALRKVPSEQAKSIVVAYEPVWAIGTGEVATPEDAQEVCAAIRGRVAQQWGEAASAAVRILYGGSVKAANVAGIMAKEDVDGCLVGGASLDHDEFGGICRFYDMPVL